MGWVDVKVSGWLAKAGLMGLLALSGVGASALTTPVHWSTPGNCTSCHDAPSSYSPFFDDGPSAGLRAGLASNALFKQYVNNFQVSGSSPSPLMSGLSQANADAIRPYMLQRLFGEITGASSPGAPAHAHAFANTLVGNTAQVVLTITNHRTSAVAFTLTGIGTTSSSNFWYSESCPSSIAAGGTCDVTVHFTPQSMGSKSDQFIITVDGFAQTVDLTGLGQARQFSVSPTNLPVNAMVGTSTTVQTTVTNSGNLSLTLGAPSFSGGAAADYSLDGASTCTSGGVVAGSGSCLFVVRFSPSIDGVRSATLNIPHNAPGSPHLVTLSGTATPIPAPTISANAVALNFADTQLGSNTAQVFTVENVGDAALTFSAFNRTGTGAADYTLGGTCSTSTPLAPAGTCTMSVTFAPAALGSRPASLTIASNASNGAYVLALTGTGIPVPVPVVTLSTLLVDFGNQTIGGLYQARTVTLSNTGTANLNLASITIAGSGFSIANPGSCGASLAPSASCDIQVRFDPATQASASGTLSVASNAAGSPHQVSLQGSGVAFAAPVLAWPVSLTSIDFGSQAVGGGTAVQVATLTNQGPGGATINLVNAIGPDAANFSVTLSGCSVGTVLYQGQTCDVQIQFVPGGAGTRTATVQFASTGSPPTTLTVTGTGTSGPLPILALSQGTLSFGEVREGASSSPQPVVLRNDGSSTLRVTSASATGPYSVQSQDCPAMPFDLPVGASCTLTVTFTPGTAGAQAGVLSVNSSASPSALEITLNGQGEQAREASGGGCSLATGDTVFDPTLWALVLGAAGVLAHRRRQAQRAKRSRP